MAIPHLCLHPFAVAGQVLTAVSSFSIHHPLSFLFDDVRLSLLLRSAADHARSLWSDSRNRRSFCYTLDPAAWISVAISCRLSEQRTVYAFAFH